MEFELENGVSFQPNSKFWIGNAAKTIQKKSSQPIISAFLQVISSYRQERYEDALKSQIALNQDLIRDFRFETIRLLHVHLCNMIHIAILTGNDACLEEATRVLMKAFNYSLNDRSPLEISRKWASYSIIILLFKAFVRLGTLNLIKNSLLALGNAQLPPLEEHPQSVKVAFHFYTGYYDFSNERYIEAMHKFLSAFEQCHKGSMKNKLLCLKYLVPCSLINGYMPSRKLIRKYAKKSETIRLYADLVQNIRSGNLLMFQKNLSENEHHYLSEGVYLVLERLKTMCLLRLLKRIYILQNKATRLSILSFLGALEMCGYEFVDDDVDKMDMDSADNQQLIESKMDEAECLIAGLISQGYVKGYLSREKRTLVLSNTDPFPKYSEVIRRVGLRL